MLVFLFKCFTKFDHRPLDLFIFDNSKLAPIQIKKMTTIFRVGIYAIVVTDFAFDGTYARGNADSLLV